MKIIKKCTLLLIIIFILTGCKTEKNQAVKIQKKDNAPDSLGDVSEGLQDILKEVEKIEKILDGTDIEEEKPEEKEESSSSEKNQDSSGDKSGEKNSKKTEEKNTTSMTTEEKNKKKLEEKNEKLLMTWKQVDKSIEDTHNKWNAYEVEGLEKGLTTDRTNKFEKSLNALTKSIEDRNIMEIYDYGSQSMLNLRPMLELYKDEIGGEINKIKYATYQSYLRFIKGEDIEALNSLQNLDEDINKIRLKSEKDEDNIKILDKVIMSIADMKKSLNEKSIKLIRIKKDIIIKNLEELKK